MKTRMQPIDNVWTKLPRLVRDLAVACGREVRLELEGRETELDKTILEAIKDPLTHLVRNCVDHGIESSRGARRGRQAGRGHADPARLPRGRPGHHRDQRRRRRHRPGARSPRRRSSAAWRPPTQLRAMTAARDRQSHLRAGLLDRRPRSPTCPAAASAWTSCDQHREDRRHRRRRKRAGPRHHVEDQDPADAGDHSGADGRVRRRALRGSAGQPRRVVVSRRRRKPERASSTCPARRSSGCAAR